MSKIVDARGKLCPQPLIMTRAAIKESARGERIEVYTDNEMACINIMNYLSELDIAPVVKDGEGYRILSFDNNGASPGDVAVSCPSERKVSGDECRVVVLKSDVMGSGDTELGALLLRSYLNTLTAMETQPRYILAYNSGIKCAMKGSDTAVALSTLVEKGVKVVLCGTCVDYYGVKDEIAVGEIGNMLRIAEILSEASAVVYP